MAFRLRVLSVLVLMIAAVRPAAALDIDLSSFTLGNGMQVVVIPDHRAPVVTHMVWYKVGAADEPKGKAGIAHFLEHLMFKGTSNHPVGEFSQLVRANGGDENAFTTQDYTAYFQRIAKERLALVMELEADRMQNLVLTDENVLPELKVVQEERRERIENDPSGLLAEQLDAGMVSDGIAYLTADSLRATPFAQAFRVLEELPGQEKHLRRALAERGIGSLEIKKRGADVDPAALRTRLKLRGPNRATLILTRTQGRHVTLLAERCDLP